ncbi:MAG TPA: hypothetical protein VMB19_10160 [Silvibacterium sp.]|nr:hypothetical protein [Silvibacterium sp.]
MSVKEALIAAWKFCLSFRKSAWELTDYPIVIRKQRIADPASSSPEPVHPAYSARIVNWWVVTGCGNNPGEAAEDLTAQFARMRDGRRRDGKPLPRPGTKVPLEFAPSNRVHAHPELTEDFIQRVLGLDWAFVSDESSLWDFHTDKTNDLFNAKIKDVYGVDVSDIESGNLAMILGRIHAAQIR